MLEQRVTLAHISAVTASDGTECPLVDRPFAIDDRREDAMWITGDKGQKGELTVAMKKLFPKRAGLAADYVEIMQFLSDRPLFEKMFRDVSAHVEDFYKFRKQRAHRNALTGSFHNLFRCLHRASDTVGCDFPMTHEDIVILKGDKISVQNVTLTGNAATLFGGIVSRGYLFKDETGPSHGEYAHTIQWLVIAYAKYFGVIKLDTAVLDLYKQAAGSGSLVSGEVYALDADTDALIVLKNRTPVWSFIVDCFRSGERNGLPEDFPGNVFVENYRSPGYLTDQMLHRRLRDTFLGTHIQNRYLKKAITTGVGSRVKFRNDWLTKQKVGSKEGALKFEGTTTNTLSPDRLDLSPLLDDLKGRTKDIGTFTTKL